MNLWLKLSIIGIGLAGTAAPLSAHHAFGAEFDANKPVTLRGSVTKVEWVNPHAWIQIAVKDKSGKSVIWSVEGGAPNALARRGWRPAMLPIGTEIIVEGYQAKDGEPKANGRDLTLPDGRKLFMGSPGTGAPEDKESGK
jgi:uncharacterized protein DUF6152